MLGPGAVGPARENPGLAVNSAYVALGSNLEDPFQQVTRAVVEINQLPGTRVMAVSDWYRTRSLLEGLDDFVNGVVRLSTELTPHELLRALQTIEQAHQRERTIRWGSRTLDLDILLYNNLALDSAELVIPHPEMARRNFVLVPLADLEPALRLPDGTPLVNLLENCPTEGIVPLSRGDESATGI